jgi:nucleoside-diphosphate-sugar epimerase
VRRGHHVTLLHRGHHPNEVRGAESVVVDRADPSALALAIGRARPDVVVDTRAMTRADAESAALALKIHRVPCVVLSSQDVYAQFGAVNGHPAPPPEPRVTEGSPLTVPFPYRGLGMGGTELDYDEYDKKLVERVFEQATQDGIPAVTVLRLPAVYGARDPKRRFGFVVDSFDAGRRDIPSAGGASWRWTHAHVRDVAHAIVLAAEQTAQGWRVFNVGEAETPTMRDRVEAIAGHMGIAVRWVEHPAPLPDDLAWLGRMPNDLVVDSSLVRASLGFAEVTTARERLDDLIGGLRASRPVGSSRSVTPGV